MVFESGSGQISLGTLKKMIRLLVQDYDLKLSWIPKPNKQHYVRRGAGEIERHSCHHRAPIERKPYPIIHGMILNLLDGFKINLQTAWKKSNRQFQSIGLINQY